MIFTMERTLGLDANCVASIEGYAPVCPPGAKTKRKKILLPDDYLHYGAFSRLTLRPGSGIDAQKLADELAFCSLSIFGSLFIDLLEQAAAIFSKSQPAAYQQARSCRSLRSRKRQNIPRG